LGADAGTPANVQTRFAINIASVSCGIAAGCASYLADPNEMDEKEHRAGRRRGAGGWTTT